MAWRETVVISRNFDAAGTRARAGWSVLTNRPFPHLRSGRKASKLALQNGRLLIVALALIVGGIAFGTVGDIRAVRTTVPAKL